MTDKSDKTQTDGDFATFEDTVFRYSRGGPARKSPKTDDPLKDVLETLYSEHRYIGSLLDTLEQQAQRLKPGKIPDYHLLLEIVDYLAHYPDQYHHPREDLLFSRMLDRDKGFQARLDRLLREHRTLSHYSHQLLNELTAIADGRPVSQAELRASIGRYIDGYRQHMEYESREVFPRAKGTLNRADLRKLEARTRYIDDPLFGGEVQYRYRRLGRRVQSRMEIAGSQLIAREMSGIELAISNLTEAVETIGQLRIAVGRQQREAWRQQLDTVRDHARPGEGPGLFSLPLALARNRRRQLSEGFDEIREILRRDKGG